MGRIDRAEGQKLKNGRDNKFRYLSIFRTPVGRQLPVCTNDFICQLCYAPCMQLDEGLTVFTPVVAANAAVEEPSTIKQTSFHSNRAIMETKKIFFL